MKTKKVAPELAGAPVPSPPRIFRGVLYKVYFEFPTGDIAKLIHEGVPPMMVYVLANNVAEAMAKVQALYPNQVVTSVFAENNPGLGRQIERDFLIV
jgi:hypothetical protein